jgi:hypothetical protein
MQSASSILFRRSVKRRVAADEPAVDEFCSRSPPKGSCTREEGVVIIVSSDSEEDAGELHVDEFGNALDEFGNPQEDTPPRSSFAHLAMLSPLHNAAIIDSDRLTRAAENSVLHGKVLKHNIHFCRSEEGNPASYMKQGICKKHCPYEVDESISEKRRSTDAEAAPHHLAI